MLYRFLPVLLLCAKGFAGDVLTYHNDNSRTGQNLTETTLTPSNVTVNSFGLRFNISVDGKVDAEPLYAAGVNFGAQGTHNALYVATEHDSVYAFDADSGANLWMVSMLQPGETTSDARGCSQVVPEIGITSTPVISRTNGPHGTIYVVAMSKDGSGNYYQRLHALDMTTGAEQFSGPVNVQATYPGLGDNSSNGYVVFDPKQYEERASLLLLNDVIYTSWSSHCDDEPYTGWVIGYSDGLAKGILAQLYVYNFNPNAGQGAVWMSGAGPAADASGNIYFLAANGQFDTTINDNGFPANGDFGNAFMKLSLVNNALGATDFFAMANVTAENNSDTDLGSGGTLLLPDMKDSTGATRQLAVGAGKDDHIYLVDRNSMGKFNATTNDSYQDLPDALPGGEYGMPAYFNGAIYYGGVSDVIRKFTFTNAHLNTTPAATSPNSFGYPGATPSISANGSSNGIVWAAENTNPAVLHAYDANDLHELYNSNQAGTRDQFGAGNKFITPMIANGKVYVGTTNSVGVFGLAPRDVKPVLRSALAASGTNGKPFLYRIDAANNPTSFTATKLPAGLSLNAETGVISGTPKRRGTTKVTIGAKNPTGASKAILTITIARH